MQYCFGDIVVVDGDKIGVVVKSWLSGTRNEPTHEVYVRSYNAVHEYAESAMQRYMVRHKYLNDEELVYQHNAIFDV